MKEINEGLLHEIAEEWSVAYLDNYIKTLEERVLGLNQWISYLKKLKKRKSKKTLQMGARNGR